MMMPSACARFPSCSWIFGKPLNLYFEIASAASIKSFVALLKNSFCENSYDANKKYELFFQRFFQLKEGYDSFRQALASNPKLWLEFRKNNPNLFKEI